MNATLPTRQSLGVAICIHTRQTSRIDTLAN